MKFVSVFIEITDKCNKNCSYCYNRINQSDSQKNFIKEDLIYNLINNLNLYGNKEIILSGGEPKIHPKFCNILDYLMKNNFNCKINTNCFITSTFEGDCPDGVTNCKCEETGKNEVLCSTDDFFATLPSWASDYSYICGENIWEDVTIGYQRNQVFESKLGSCLSYSVSYRCANSYYGAPKNTTSGCTPCPEPGISYTPDNKTITMCFVSPKETLSDETGTYSFTTNCYYSE